MNHDTIMKFQKKKAHDLIEFISENYSVSKNNIYKYLARRTEQDEVKVHLSTIVKLEESRRVIQLLESLLNKIDKVPTNHKIKLLQGK